MNDTDYFKQGLDLATQKKYEEAIECFRKVPETSPDYAEVQYYWGQALSALKKHEEAVEQYSKALETSPDNANLHFGLGGALRALKKYEEAIEHYSKALERDPENAYAQNGWGKSLHALKKYEEAIEHYVKANNIRPEYADPQYNWGLVLQSQKKYEEAIGHYRKTLELSPDFLDAHNAWGSALYSLKKYEEAIDHYHKALEISPDDAYAHNGWGIALNAQKKHEEAIPHFRKALEISPDYAESQYNWGSALDSLKRYEEAIEHYRKAIELKPDDAYAYNVCGNAFYALKKYEKAIEHYVKANEISPDYDDPQYNWGLAFEALKRYEEAIEHYSKAIELNSDNVGAHNGLGNAFYALRNYEESIEHYRKASEISPESADPQYNWGLALTALKRYEEAIGHYEKAIDINPKSSLACYACHNISEILWIRGKYNEGRFAWERALKIYKQSDLEEEKNRNADFFLYYGAGLIRYSRDLLVARGEALDVFKRGLAIDQKHTGILAATITTSLDWLNEPRYEGKEDSHGVVNYHRAREYFKVAEGVLKERLKTGESQENITVETKQELGNLYLIMEEYDEAEPLLTDVSKINSESSAAHNILGVLHFRKGDYGKARQCFETARRRDRDDLNLWSNLAEVYLKINPKELAQIEKAECEFKKVLKVAHDHIDSLIGLGEVFVSKAETGDKDFYEGAIKYYSQAIQLSENSQGSKLLTNREKASLHYSLGYARVMFYEASKPLASESILKDARENFDRSLFYNPEHYKAEMALEKLGQRLGRFSQSLFPEKMSAWLVVVLSIFVFVMAQWSIIHDIKAISGLAYSGLTFGSLIFIVVGLYLPSIQKLKGAGIELEKSTTTQISGPSSIQIAK